MNVPDIITGRNIRMKSDVDPCFGLFQKQSAIFLVFSEPLQQGLHSHYCVQSPVTHQVDCSHSTIFHIEDFVKILDCISYIPFLLQGMSAFRSRRTRGNRLTA